MYTEVREIEEALKVSRDWLQQGFTVEITPVDGKFRVKRNGYKELI